MSSDDVKFEDIDASSGLLEVRQAYALGDDELREQVRAAVTRVGPHPKRMNLAELCLVREWVRRRLEVELEPESFQALREQFEWLCSLLAARVPPLS